LYGNQPQPHALENVLRIGAMNDRKSTLTGHASLSKKEKNKNVYIYLKLGHQPEQNIFINRLLFWGIQ